MGHVLAVFAVLESMSDASVIGNCVWNFWRYEDAGYTPLACRIRGMSAELGLGRLLSVLSGLNLTLYYPEDCDCDE